MSNLNLTGEFESQEQEVQSVVEFTTESFLSVEEILKLLPLAKAWGEKSMSEQVKILNSFARKMSGDKVSPLVVLTRDDLYVYPHVTYLSKMSSFSPLLALPHSGQGFSTMEKIEIRHPAVLCYEVTIGELREVPLELPEEGKPSPTELQAAFNAKVAYARKVLKLMHGEVKDPNFYRIGETLEEGTMMYHLDYGDGRKVAGPRISKAGFKFIVESVPELDKSDFTLVGNPTGSTRAKVQVKIHGHWYGTSEAEKFAAMLTKLCVDKMPRTEGPNDLLKGGILLYEDDTTLPLEEMALQILEGTRTPCPLTDVGSGQETQKGAPTAEPAAAFLKALTGKGVLRKEEFHTQLINGKDHDMGWVVWDNDAFVDFRSEWNEASIHQGVWVRWVDDWMNEVLVDSTKKKAQDFHRIQCPVGGWFWFHRTEVRVELAPLTLETATQLECRSIKPKGSIFSELNIVLGQLDS